MGPEINQCRRANVSIRHVTSALYEGATSNFNCMNKYEQTKNDRMMVSMATCLGSLSGRRSDRSVKFSTAALDERRRRCLRNNLGAQRAQRVSELPGISVGFVSRAIDWVQAPASVNDENSWFLGAHLRVARGPDIEKELRSLRLLSCGQLSFLGRNSTNSWIGDISCQVLQIGVLPIR